MSAQPEQPKMSMPLWVYGVLGFWFRAAYGFELKSVEQMPHQGPVILLPTDILGFLGPIVQMLALRPAMSALTDSEVRQVSFMHEQIYGLVAKNMTSAKFPMYGVRPHDAGTQGLSLIDGYRALQEGGLVNINPEGDQSWNGAGVGIKPGCAWLALRSGAQCVLLAPSSGLYDIWPFWERGPSLRGKMSLSFSKPFTVTDRPLDRVADEDLASAKAIISAELDALRYGPEGLSAWAEPPRLRGEALAELPPLRRDMPDRKRSYRKTPAIKQGMGLLLFQCPICGATDSLAHRRGLLQHNHVACRSCGARWQVKRQFGKDYRLILTRGPAELLGLDVALSQLHAYVKDQVQVEPLAAAPDSVANDDQPLLIASKCKLMPYDLSMLQQPLANGLAPTVRAEDHLQMPSQQALGVGELTMTARGMVWRSKEHTLTFDWEQVKALHLYFRNVITIAHGAALYTLNLGNEGAIKWITYADKLLNGDANGGGQANGKRVPVSPH